MKSKLVLVVFLVFAISIAFSSASYASGFWCKGDIVLIGQAEAGPKLTVKHTSNGVDYTRFVVAADANKFLAVALTAKSLNIPVEAFIDFVQGGYTMIQIVD